MLDDATRDALRAAGLNAKQATDERNQLIRDAAANGGSLREIAVAVGLSHTAVARILGRDPK